MLCGIIFVLNILYLSKIKINELNSVLTVEGLGKNSAIANELSRRGMYLFTLFDISSQKALKSFLSTISVGSVVRVMLSFSPPSRIFSRQSGRWACLVFGYHKMEWIFLYILEGEKQGENYLKKPLNDLE